MSIGFLIDPEQPMVWRGPMVTQALTQLLGDTDWGDLDYLVIDMPPGTGDIQLTLAQRVPVAGAVIVTTPQDIALADARKGLKMFEKVNVPVLGIVENMSVHVCSNCGHVEHLFGAGGGARMAAQYGVELLGELPLDARVREEADGGAPTVVAAPGFAARRAVLRHGAPHRRGARAPREGSFDPVPQNRRGRKLEATMSIKSDHWIRRMAEKEKMIEPFAPRAGAPAADGHKIVSYGTSSYGYDVRCSREFKIFTNINSTIVDPKTFDEKSFVDVHADVCIIPPNSFALARTVEYFRIPRSTLVVCLGQVDVCALRNHRQRDAARAGVGRARDAGVLQHHAAAREDLRQRRRGADAVLRVGRSVLDVVQGSRREVPGPDGRDAAEDLIGTGDAKGTTPRSSPFAGMGNVPILSGRRTRSAA